MVQWVYLLFISMHRQRSHSTKRIKQNLGNRKRQHLGMFGSIRCLDFLIMTKASSHILHFIIRKIYYYLRLYKLKIYCMLGFPNRNNVTINLNLTMVKMLFVHQRSIKQDNTQI